MNAFKDVIENADVPKNHKIRKRYRDNNSQVEEVRHACVQIRSIHAAEAGYRETQSGGADEPGAGAVEDHKL